MANFDECECPSGALDIVTVEECSPTKQPKVQFMLFRKQGNLQFVDGANEIGDSTSWTGLMDATDDTVVIRTPSLKEVTFAEPDTIEDSENFDGATTIGAVLPQTVTAIIDNIHPDNAKQLDSLFCNSKVLSVAWVYSSDRMHVSKVNDTPTYDFIPISEDTIITKTPSREAALGSKFQYMIEFKLRPDWYSNGDVVAPVTPFSFKDDLKPTA